jgi:hypothetical protein
MCPILEISLVHILYIGSSCDGLSIFKVGKEAYAMYLKKKTP